MTDRRPSPLLELDGDLGALVPPERIAEARAQLQVRVHRLPTGVWDVGRLSDASPEHVGLLLLDGVLSREVLVADTVSTELLGPGDVIRPWALNGHPTLLKVEIRWNALTDSRVALLDRQFGVRLGHWPEVNSVLIDRLNDRAQRLATTQAISQLNRVDRRLLALFWHLAERWGRITAGGVVVPLTLSHRMLGQLIGARRPTVSTAIGELARREELIRRPDGTWLLLGEPLGLPATGSERVVPLRRHLLGRGPVEDEAPPAEHPGEEDGAATAGDAATAAAELHAALGRLGADSQSRADRLHSIRADTERLVGEATELLEERQRAGERVAPPVGG